MSDRGSASADVSSRARVEDDGGKGSSAAEPPNIKSLDERLVLNSLIIGYA